ncbi:hypothetical protein EDD86DRAFT_57334 [Gorgonomyces haynaldii]|nr:hypothetical protein EDD86DRAFT_57334 [Gorgonomyces haynaldii]
MLSTDLEKRLLDDSDSETTDTTVNYNTCTLKCKTCDESFTSRIAQDNHMRQEHTDAIYCYECGSLFTEKYQLLQHMSTHQPQVGPALECSVCFTPFASIHEYDDHVKLHYVMQEQFVEFPCIFCDAVFNDNHLLMEHDKEAHQPKVEQKPRVIECSTCHEVFTRHSDLSEHLKTHGLKPYKCKECDSRFTSKVHLVTHERTVHSDEKPFSCPKCATSFKTNGNLTRHLKRVHGIKRVH